MVGTRRSQTQKQHSKQRPAKKHSQTKHDHVHTTTKVIAQCAAASLNNTSKPTIQQRRRILKFSSKLVTKTISIPNYNRQPTPIDSFTCDVCGVEIPAGIKGFEPYASCIEEKCDGYDVCVKCVSLPSPPSEVHYRGGGEFHPDESRPATVSVEGHEHKLCWIDRQAEVKWSNEGTT